VLLEASLVHSVVEMPWKRLMGFYTKTILLHGKHPFSSILRDMQQAGMDPDKMTSTEFTRAAGLLLAGKALDKARILDSSIADTDEAAEGALPEEDEEAAAAELGEVD